MIIAGGNEGITTKGKPLRDGGAAIIESGKLVYASGEERHTRVKADGGYSSSLAKGMGVDGVDGVDVLWLSSCCEPLRRSEVSKHYVDHHLSHAALAYYASGFERALVIVVDDGGNVLDSMSGNSWWEYPRQQLTIFEGKGDNLSLLGREFSLPLACGLGEFYRAFTYFLGWPSGRHAGKLMAMSGHGPRFSSDHDPFFRFHRTRLAHKAKFFHPARPKDTARSFLTAAGRDDLIEKLARNKDGFSARAEIASMVQHSLEINLVTLVKQWARALDVENVCMAGGVALNCTAALRVREETGLNVFVPPAAGDMGQCVGNAITGYVNATGKRPEIASWAFIGPDMNISEMEVRSVVKKYRNQMRIRHVAGVKKNTEAARALFDGEIV
ncbi:carbamoyltransferase N-terminal domain-containing protein, partial [Parasphingorhabdus sp.]